MDEGGSVQREIAAPIRTLSMCQSLQRVVDLFEKGIHTTRFPGVEVVQKARNGRLGILIHTTIWLRGPGPPPIPLQILVGRQYIVGVFGDKHKWRQNDNDLPDFWPSGFRLFIRVRKSERTKTCMASRFASYAASPNFRGYVSNKLAPTVVHFRVTLRNRYEKTIPIDASPEAR